MGEDLGQEVAGAVRAGRREERLGVCLFGDLAVRHEDDAVGGAASEAHLVGDDDHGHTVFRESDHDVEHLVDHLGVERGGRLVEQHDLGAHGQGAGDRDALLLAAGQGCGELLRLVLHAHALEEGEGLLLGVALRHAPGLDGAEGHVVEDGPVGEEVEGLEDHADVGAQAGEVLPLFREDLAVDADGARVDRLEAVDRAAQGRLARA